MEPRSHNSLLADRQSELVIGRNDEMIGLPQETGNVGNPGYSVCC